MTKAETDALALQAREEHELRETLRKRKRDLRRGRGIRRPEYTIPAPGSDAAVADGCSCPVLDNAHGQGLPWWNGVTAYWLTVGCPVHNPKGAA